MTTVRDDIKAQLHEEYTRLRGQGSGRSPAEVLGMLQAARDSFFDRTRGHGSPLWFKLTYTVMKAYDEAWAEFVTELEPRVEVPPSSSIAYVLHRGKVVVTFDMDKLPLQVEWQDADGVPMVVYIGPQLQLHVDHHVTYPRRLLHQGKHVLDIYGVDIARWRALLAPYGILVAEDD